MELGEDLRGYFVSLQTKLSAPFENDEGSKIKKKKKDFLIFFLSVQSVMHLCAMYGRKPKGPKSFSL